MKKTNLNCFLPSFIDHSGHENSYLKVFERFSKNKKFNISLYVSKDNRIKTKLKKYNIFFRNKKNIIAKFFNIFQNVKEINKLTRSIKNQEILYLDGYSFYFLLALILSNANNKKYKKLILFCRYNHTDIKRSIFKIIIFLLDRKFIDCELLTDNYLNYKIYKNQFNKKINLFPTPFFSKKEKIINHNKFKKTILCPGQYRQEKFGNNLIFFLQKNENNRIMLSISTNFKNKISKKIKLFKFKENLDKKKYLQLIKTNQIIILPYDEYLYKFRTSGIFFETINYNKLIFVTQNTFFANELKKFNLKELIIDDWSKFDLEQKLKKLKLKEIYKKIKIMRNKYSIFHNNDNFINSLKKICEK